MLNIMRTPSGQMTMTLASILKKTLMALTGLAWFIYLLLHLAGNLQLWAGPEKFNGYAHALISNPLLIPAEIGLVLTLLVHVFSGWRVTNENFDARPQGYLEKVASSGSSTLASRTMYYGGLVLLVFIIIHVWMFKYGDHSGTHGLWGLVVRSFKNPWITLGYVLAMLPLGLHLSHGFSSAFQTLGLTQARWWPGFKCSGQVLGWVIAIGFILLPLWALFFAEA